MLFAFYQGESLGYIGSSFHVFELIANSNRSHSYNTFKKFSTAFKDPWEYSGIRNINFDQIGFVLELNQLAIHDDDDAFWLFGSANKKIKNSSSKNNQPGLYHNKTSLAFCLQDSLIYWSHTVPNVSLNHAHPNRSLPIPPSSVHSFMSNDHKNHIETAVITNHKGSFTNRYYHSIFDQVLEKTLTANLKVKQQKQNNKEAYSPLAKHLSKIATVVSRSLVEFISGNSDDNHKANIPLEKIQNIFVDSQLISNTLECVFINQNCSFFNEIQRPGYYNESKFQLLKTNSFLEIKQNKNR